MSSARLRRVLQSIRAVLKEMPLLHAFDAFALVKGFLQLFLGKLGFGSLKSSRVRRLVVLGESLLTIAVLPAFAIVLLPAAIVFLGTKGFGFLALPVRSRVAGSRSPGKATRLHEVIPGQHSIGSTGLQLIELVPI